MKYIYIYRREMVTNNMVKLNLIDLIQGGR